MVVLLGTFGVLAWRCDRETAADVQTWRYERDLASRTEVRPGPLALEFGSELPADDDPRSQVVSEETKRRRREDARRREVRARNRAALDEVRGAIIDGDEDAIRRAVDACLSLDHDPEDELDVDPIRCAGVAYRRALHSKQNLAALADLYAEHLETRGALHKAAEVHVDLGWRLERTDRDEALSRYQKGKALLERLEPDTDDGSGPESVAKVDAAIAKLKKRRSR